MSVNYLKSSRMLPSCWKVKQVFTSDIKINHISTTEITFIDNKVDVFR